MSSSTTYIDERRCPVTPLGSFARAGALFHDIAYRQLYVVVSIEATGAVRARRFGDPQQRVLEFPTTKHVRPCSGEHRRLAEARWEAAWQPHEERSLGGAVA